MIENATVNDSLNNIMELKWAQKKTQNVKKYTNQKWNAPNIIKNKIFQLHQTNKKYNKIK